GRLRSRVTGTRGPPGRERYDSPLEREPDQVRPAAKPQLAHEIRAVTLRGAGADEEPSRDLAARQPLRHQMEHLALPGRQRIVGIDAARALEIGVDELVR